MNQVHIGWDKVKLGDRVKYHSPTQGNHTGIVVRKTPPHGITGYWLVEVQPISTAAALRGEVSHDLMTLNHSLWEIY